MTCCSENSTVPGFFLASSTIHCRFVNRFAGSMSLPVCPANGSLCTAPPFPRSGPGEPGSPLSQVLWRRYDFPSAYQRSLIGFASTAHAILLLCVRRSAPGGSKVPSRPGPWVPAARSSGCCVWTLMGSLRSSGDPSRAFAPLQDPGRTDVASPLTTTSMLPPLGRRRRLRRHLISRLTHAALAPAGLRFTRALPHTCKARFRLVG
jgi:hypothetical protein